jgi:putative ABC transport system permease protein
MFRYLPLILKSSMRNKRRSLLTIASAATSLCLLGTLMAIYQAFYTGEAPPQQALRLITRNRASPAIPLPVSYRNRIQHVPGWPRSCHFNILAECIRSPGTSSPVMP